VLVDLLRTMYQNDTILPQDSAFYHNALEEIEWFGISSQVYYLLKRFGMLETAPDFFRKQLKHNYTQALYHNILIRNQTEQLLNHFETNRIDVIPLKGVLFAETYFGDFGARWTSDIDLLVRPSQLEKAIQCAAELGYNQEAELIPFHFHRSFSKAFKDSPKPLTVELHWNVLKQNTSALNIEPFWKHAKIKDSYQHVMELSDVDVFYMICLHGWRHNLDSPKYFIDIIQMIHHMGPKIDYTLMLERAAKDRTVKRIIRTLTIVYQHFPHLQTVKFWSWKKKVNWRDDAFIKGKQEKKLKHYLDFIDYQLFSYDTTKHSFTEFQDWLLAMRKRD
jgi:hypothetical protein